MLRNKLLNRNLSINQSQNKKLLILYEFVRRFLQIIQMSSFQKKNYRKSLENVKKQYDITEIKKLNKII